MCWSRPGSPGHVGIVEWIDPDGSFYISQSSWGGYLFNVVHYKKPSDIGNGYIYQGCIYNPAYGSLAMPAISEWTVDDSGSIEVLSTKDKFIAECQSHANEDSTWVRNCIGLQQNAPWSAAFVIACAKTVGSMINICIPNTTSCSSLPKIGSSRGYGKWLPGPANNSNPTPEEGDIVFFRTSSYKSVNAFTSDSCGIVIKVSDKSIHVVKGDSGGRVERIVHLISSSLIVGYYRPNWDRLSQDLATGTPTVQGLYTDEVTRNDATLREVGYLNSSYQPSINSSKIRLSVINYTGLLADMYSIFSSSSSTSDAVDTDLVVVTEKSSPSVAADFYSVSEDLIKIVQKYEPYYDIAQWDRNEKLYKIGWSSTSRIASISGIEVTSGLKIDKNKALSLLKMSLMAETYPYVKKFDTKFSSGFSQNELDALASFCRSCGSNNLTDLMNKSKSKKDVADNMLKYCTKPGDTSDPGYARRKVESRLFYEGVLEI